MGRGERFQERGQGLKQPVRRKESKPSQKDFCVKAEGPVEVGDHTCP